MSAIRVLIIADDHFARSGLTALLDVEEDISIVASHESSIDLEDSTSTYLPTVIIWDLGWDLSDSIEQLENYVTSSSEAEGTTTGILPVVALVNEAEDSIAVRDAGARAILLRDAETEKLAHAVRSVVAGLHVFDADLEQYLFSSVAMPVEPLVESLTPRELEILQLIAEGLANKAIARQLNISDHTVKFHTTAIFGKLGVSSRTEAVVRATRAGLIML